MLSRILRTLLISLAFVSIYSNALANIVEVKLKDYQTGLTYSGQRVVVDIISPTSSRWFKNLVTDEDGKLRIDTSILKEDESFKLYLNIFNTKVSRLIVDADSTNQVWSIGKVKIRLTNGLETNTPLLKNHKVKLFKDHQGKFTPIATFESNSNGYLVFDVDEFFSNGSYVIRSLSSKAIPFNFDFKFNEPGEYDFKVGEAPHKLSVLDAMSRKPIPNLKVSAWTKVQNGEALLIDSLQSDVNGEVTFFIATDIFKGGVYFSVKPFGRVASFSELAYQPSQTEFLVGKTAVTVLDGSSSDLSIMPNKSVALVVKNMRNSQEEWIQWYITDENGVVRADLTPLGDDYYYTFAAKSKTDKKFKYSEVLPTQGELAFAVGNPPVKVFVYDVNLAHTPEDLSVTAEILNENDIWTWAATEKTNAEGLAVFDLNNINGDSQFRFRASSYEGKVYSETVMKSGTYSLRVGEISAVLSDANTSDSLVDIKVDLYKIENDGSLSYEAQEYSDVNGKVVFDARDLTNSNYVLKAFFPLDNLSHAYSEIIKQPSLIDFAISSTDVTSIDTVAPDLQLLAPIGTELSASEISVVGSVFDSQGIASLNLTAVVYNNKVFRENIPFPANGAWELSIPSSYLADTENLSITIEAVDHSGNVSVIERSFEVRTDTLPPSIQVQSHKNNDSVNDNGFIVTGVVIDDIQVESLDISVIDENVGILLLSEPIDFEKTSGKWSYFINSKLLTSDSKFTIVLNSRDKSQNKAKVHLNVLPIKTNFNLSNLISRTTFGHTSILESEIIELSIEEWIDEQLNPSTIDDSFLEQQLSEFDVNDLQKLRARELMYKIYSKRQLNEIMTTFWENHFNTNYNSHGNYVFEMNENDLFREHAMSNFRRLLEISAKSPAMLMYLDNHKSTVGNLNENYSREILELHTLGDTKSYSQKDVHELSRIFSGWRVSESGTFEFLEALHDPYPKTFLGHDIQSTGEAEGDLVLDLLSIHPLTAHNICDKLIAYLVNTEINPRLLNECSTVFLNTGGDIKEILRVILLSADFNSQSNSNSKVKNPMFLYASVFRATSAKPDFERAINILSSMNMALFTYPAPDGYSELDSDWISSDSLMRRISFINQLVLSGYGGSMQIAEMITEEHSYSKEAIIQRLLELILLNSVSDSDFRIATDYVSERIEYSNANDLQDLGVREVYGELISLLLNSPKFQFR